MVDPEPEELLVERAKREAQAFGELYERYVGRVYSYMYHRVGNAQDAEDLTERVFFQALTNLPRYTNRGVPFAAWLFRIAHNLVANWHRDEGRRRAIPLEEVLIPPVSSDDLVQWETQALVRKAVATLAPLRQHLLVLKYGEGMSNAEIGQVIGKSEGAVKALLHRTLRSLQVALEGEEVDNAKDLRSDG